MERKREKGKYKLIFLYNGGRRKTIESIFNKRDIDIDNDEVVDFKNAMRELKNIQNFYNQDILNKTVLEKEMMIMLKNFKKRTKTINEPIYRLKSRCV